MMEGRACGCIRWFNLSCGSCWKPQKLVMPGLRRSTLLQSELRHFCVFGFRRVPILSPMAMWVVAAHPTGTGKE